MVTTEIVLPKLHSGQQKVRDSKARFRVLACGRRWGKTRLGSALCIEAALMGGRSWWVAPSYKVANVGWRLLSRLAHQLPSVDISKANRIITFPNGGEVAVRSADNPDSLRGEGLDFVVMDECAFVKEEAWNEALRPALSDRLGRAVFISTPKGRNWFYRAFVRGQDSQQTDWQAWQLPTTDNPYIIDSEIEEARRDLPERIFLQEYLAQFLDDAGGVFRNVMNCATAAPQLEAKEGHQYIFGVDWGKMNDFTVITVIDTFTNELVYIDRFNQIDYTLQSSRLLATAERFKPVAIIAERNSMGQPIIEQLDRMGLPIQPFQTTNASKAQVIEDLALAFEREQLAIINDDILINELMAYEAERLPSGTLRYNAPAGLHDDCVMSLALCYFGANGGRSIAEVTTNPFYG